MFDSIRCYGKYRCVCVDLGGEVLHTDVLTVLKLNECRFFFLLYLNKTTIFDHKGAVYDLFQTNLHSKCSSDNNTTRQSEIIELQAQNTKYN